MSKTRSLHHIVYATKYRELTLSDDHKRDLYAYIFGIIKNHKCHLLRINGMYDHIHMLVDIHPTISLAELVRNVKQYSSHWLRQNPDFPDFKGWSDGYYAVSLGVDSIDACKNYIINQERHHIEVGVIEEMQTMAKCNGMMWHINDW